MIFGKEFDKVCGCTFRIDNPNSEDLKFMKIMVQIRKKEIDFQKGFVKVIVDRPMGSIHPKHGDIIYPINYGYVQGIIAGDGEEQDAYILGVDKPLKEFYGKVIAIIHRKDDVEDKWVVAQDGVMYTKHEIAEQVRFQEQYFDVVIEMKD